jgi:hypothetical protein
LAARAGGLGSDVEAEGAGWAWGMVGVGEAWAWGRVVAGGAWEMAAEGRGCEQPAKW